MPHLKNQKNIEWKWVIFKCCVFNECGKYFSVQAKHFFCEKMYLSQKLKFPPHKLLWKGNFINTKVLVENIFLYFSLNETHFPAKTNFFNVFHKWPLNVGALNEMDGTPTILELKFVLFFWWNFSSEKPNLPSLDESFKRWHIFKSNHFFLLNQPPPHKQFSYNAVFFFSCLFSNIFFSNEKNESLSFNFNWAKLFH